MNPSSPRSAVARTAAAWLRSLKAPRRPALGLALLALPLAAACGDDGPSAPDPNPAPAVTAVTPAQVPRGAAEATLTVTGSGFVRQSVARVNGDNRTTEFVSATELRARLSAADVAAAGTAQITVFSPAPGGGASGAADVTIANPAPAIASLTPGTVAAGSAGATVTVTGTGFVPESEVRAGGAARQTTYVSATELRAALTAADLAAAGPAQLTVSNPAPGGGVSAAAALAVDNPAPAIASLTPAFVATGSPGATVTVTGTGFVPGSRVLTGAAPRQTAYVSATELRVTLSAAEVAAAGTLQLRVENPNPGGGSSNAATLELRAPVPVIASLSPAHTLDGQPSVEIQVNGTGFAANSEVRFNGSARPTRAEGTTQLRATLNVGDLETAGSFPVAVFTPGPGGGTSNALAFEVRAPVPVLTQLASTQAAAGDPGFTLRVEGTGFRAGSQVRVDGAARPTRVLGPTQLEATLGEDDLRTAGNLEITVTTPAPGGGTSGALRFRVVNPAPRIELLPSRGATAGGNGFTLTVHGSGFVAGTVVRWNGADRPTTFIGPTRVSALIPASDVASPGTARVTVHTPEPGGGTSAAATMEVRPAPAAVSTSMREVAIPTHEIVWSAATGRLYASVPTGAPAYADHVIAIDPSTGAVTGSVFVGGNPWAMAVSDDGRVLYVARTASPSIQRISLATLTAGLEFPLHATARDIAVMPGRPGTLAVSHLDPGSSPSFRGVCLYDDGLRRPRCTDTRDAVSSNVIEFGEDGTVLYGSDTDSPAGFVTIGVRADGVENVRLTADLRGGGFMRYAAGRVYVESGAVIDGGRHVQVGTLAGIGYPVPDPALGRVFSVGFDRRLTAYDMNNFNAIGSFPLGGAFGVSILRWGADGLAFRSDESIYILRTPLAAP